jgi:hypothetical protein
MAGMIQSSWYSNSIPQIRLPEDSYYQLVTDAINEGMTGTDNKKNGTNVDVFSEQVVNEVVKARPGLVWKGALSGLVYWLSQLPTFIMGMYANNGAEKTYVLIEVTLQIK